jgi:hypothetical protein
MNCAEKAAYRFTWPGKDESFICEKHSQKLKTVADAMGLYIQLIPLEDNQEEMCRQK